MKREFPVVGFWLALLASSLPLYAPNDPPTTTFKIYIDADETTAISEYPDTQAGDLGSAERAAQNSSDETNFPGPYTRVNTGDGPNYNGVNGYADGIDKFGNGRPNASWNFRPLLIDAASLGNQPSAVFKVGYSASDPDLMSKTTDGAYVLPSSGVLRLWKKDGNAVRDPRSAHQGGDFINTDQAYTPSELGWSSGNEYIKLYVEVVKEETQTSFPVLVKFYEQGLSHPECMQTDQVKIRPRRIAETNATGPYTMYENQ